MELFWATLIGMLSGFILSSPMLVDMVRSARTRRAKAAVPSQAHSEYAHYCACEHLSNFHSKDGHCKAEVFVGGRWRMCACLRYSGPMGLQEMELWGLPGLSAPTPPPAEQVQKPVRALEQADTYASAMAMVTADIKTHEEQVARAVATLARGFDQESERGYIVNGLSEGVRVIRG